jgi:hypothetical protein
LNFNRTTTHTITDDTYMETLSSDGR